MRAGWRNPWRSVQSRARLAASPCRKSGSHSPFAAAAPAERSQPAFEKRRCRANRGGIQCTGSRNGAASEGHSKPAAGVDCGGHHNACIRITRDCALPREAGGCFSRDAPGDQHAFHTRAAELRFISRWAAHCLCRVGRRAAAVVIAIAGSDLRASFAGDRNFRISVLVQR